jgi:hypothetical protein
MKALNLRTAGPRKTPGRELKRPGSNERIVAANGDLNANSKKDLMKTLAFMLSEASEGRVDLEDKDTSEEITASQRNEAVIAAFGDKTSANWENMGRVLAEDVSFEITRTGFMRNLLFRNEVQGRLAMIRARENNVTVVYLTTPSQVDPQFITEKWFSAPEFNLIANVLVDGDDITIEGEDILQEKYDDALQSFVAGEDRAWKRLADSVVGTEIPLKIFSGSFNPDDLIDMMTELYSRGVPPRTVLMHFQYWTNFLGQGEFSDWFDPVTKYNMLQTGQIGSLMGLDFITDGYRPANMQVLAPGEIYMVGPPEMHGGYTDRGPITAVPTDDYNNGRDARGWFMKERLSMAIVRADSLVKGVLS